MAAARALFAQSCSPGTTCIDPVLLFEPQPLISGHVLPTTVRRPGCLGTAACIHPHSPDSHFRASSLLLGPNILSTALQVMDGRGAAFLDDFCGSTLRATRGTNCLLPASMAPMMMHEGFSATGMGMVRVDHRLQGQAFGCSR